MTITLKTGSMASGMQYDTHVLPLAVKQFRKDWPFMAARLDAMRDKASVQAAEGARLREVSAACAEGVEVSSIPVGNHGDNNLRSTWAVGK